MLEEFLASVQIDSETGKELAIGEYLYQKLVDLGMKVEKLPLKNPKLSTGFNLYGKLEGRGDAMFFSAHMDTVTPGNGIKPQVCDDGYVRSDGQTILGGDDKAGICAILEAISAIKSEKDHRTVEIVFTVGEEGGLHGAKDFDCQLLEAKTGIVLDSGEDMSELITSAPGQNQIHVEIFGKSAHAGMAPETGISAIMVGALAVSKMDLLRIDPETTANIGTFQAISPTNIVCDKAVLELEVRSRNAQKLEENSQKIAQAVRDACAHFGATCQVSIESAFQGFVLEESSEILCKSKEICKELGQNPRCVGSGGGSDAFEMGTENASRSFSQEWLTFRKTERKMQMGNRSVRQRETSYILTNESSV